VGNSIHNNQRRRAQTQAHLDRQQAQIDAQRRRIKQMQTIDAATTCSSWAVRQV
jgi:hypothetical protein